MSERPDGKEDCSIPPMDAVQVFVTDLLKPGQWRWGDNGCVMVGRGTDLDSVIFNMNLSDGDKQFLNSCKIAVDGIG
jgi:hypothetical protein